MNNIKLLTLAALMMIGVLACKKDDPITTDVYEPNIAPCVIPEEVYEIDSIIYGPSADFPNASYRITFVNTSREFAFNKVPVTGMYHMVPNLVGSYAFDNQMATAVDSGSFKVFSYVTDFAEVYIENSNNELIISHCELSNSGFYNFDQIISAYIGNPAGYRKIRMSF